MDSIAPASPNSSNGSDSDACNEDSPRVYFGPLKTPERKFIAASKNLFPPPQPAAVRRSPRLSSPRIRSASPVDVRALEDEIRDIEHVAQLISDSDEVKDSTESGMGTPQTDGDFMPDEPSSVLAERISHALDNPSPPPSPPSTLRIFDPYHTTAADGQADYHTDLMSLKINDCFETVDENSMLILSGDPQPTPISTDAATVHEQLIDFDSFSPSRMQNDIPMEIHGEVAMQPTLSVDDLLSQSPSIHITHALSSHSIVPDVTMNVASEFTEDSSKLSDKTISAQDSIRLVITPTPTQPEDRGLQNDTSDTAQYMAQASSNEGLTTPLRRSTRPRRSVTPTPIPMTNFVPSEVITTPSLARTQVKKKLSTPSRDDEIVDDSQDEQEDVRRSPFPSNTATTIRARHRSPGKPPFSFRRELGSLSPTSSNLLSTLGFNATTGPSADAPNQDPIPSSSQPMFSFSVFTPPTEAPSTPVRSTGPIRFSSPPKSSTTSPNKFRIQTPAIGDPTNTPARRIPITQAVAQGQISPEKAVQLGLMPNGLPLPSVSTPARRVLVSDSAAPTLMKSSNLRPASPLKKVPGQREASAEPGQRFASSLKGKEKASKISQERSTALPKLPFPLVPATSTSSSLSTDLKVPPQDSNKTDVKSSPAKSSLKQPTSRIPRIGAKPYARTVDPKVAQKKPTITASKTTEPAKPAPRATAVDSASLARANAREAASNLAASSSRVKPATSTLATVLKRKREVELASPTKPRVIMLRQVPPMATPPIETLQIAQPPAPTPTSNPPAKGKKVVRIRRVMDPEPAVVAKPSSSQSTAALQRESNPFSSPTAQQHVSEVPTSSTLSQQLQPTDNQDPPPGSPMIQDSAIELQTAPDNPTEESNTTSGTPDDNSGESTASMSGLRRTTRSRRAVANQDVFTEGGLRTTSTRRKPTVFRFDDIFSGMSMTALKDLTVSNTVKNQRYVAAKLETEVVRKEGTRPESPAVKIRTIVQRQQDERDRERAERANRRARRSGEDILSSDIEGAGHLGYSSGGDDQMSEDEDGSSPIRHARGAGEDDDYETPDRYKHIKGVRLFGAGAGEKAEPAKRRVKWDRGLFTTVYLDEVKLGTRQTLKENRALKSILAPTAKALRLDTLGNLPHAESPLSDIIQENITVKKIVYDSDIATAVAEVVAAAKSTRSKSKKKS